MKKRLSRLFEISAGILLLISFLQPVQSNAPPLVITAHNETVREGDTVVLTCTSNGLNTQNIAWLKDSTPLDPSVYSIVDNTLTIDSADVSTHSGDYQCIKDQLYSNIFTLTVKNFDHLVLCGQLSVGIPVIFWTIASSLTFECCYTAPFNHTDLTWTKQGHGSSDSTIVSSTSTYSLATPDNEDSGVYECTHDGTGEHYRMFFLDVYNVPSQTPFGPLTIKATDPIVCAEVGGVAELRFQTSNDVTELDWRFDNFELKYEKDPRYVLQSDRFIIYGVQESDYGIHTIKAYQKSSVQSTTIELKKNCIESVAINNSESITIGHGSTISLSCLAQVNPSLKAPLTYTWLLPNGSIYKGHTLPLPHIDYADSGTYFCTADNQYSMPQVDHIDIQVTGPLQVVTDSTEVLAKLNHTVSIQCITNTTGTEFVWRNGSTIINGGDSNRVSVSTSGLSSVLSIHRFTTYDQAVYSCEIHSNSHVTVSTDITVSLTSDIYLLWDSTTQYGSIHNSFILTCPLSGGRGDLTVAWLLNGTAVSQQEGDSIYTVGTGGEEPPQLVIPSLDVPHEYDVFTCEAQDSEGRSFSQDFKIIVEIPATFIDANTEHISTHEGDIVDLECKVTGKPMPIIEWSRSKDDERYKKYSNGTFRIENVQMEDRGSYHCSFNWKQSINTQSKFFELSVAPRQVGSANSAGSSDTTEATILGLEQNIFIAIIVAAVGGLFLILAFCLCCCLICRFCCCQKQRDSEIPRIALETTSFERKPSLRGSYRFKDNSGILDKNASQNPWTFNSQKNNNANATVIPMTAASSVAVSPGPPIPSPVPTTPAGPTTSMVTAPEFQLPNSVESFPRQNLKLDNVMGEGEFGPVFKGVARNLIKGEAQSLVAVKVLISREGEENLWPSLMEFANQMKLSSPHIASILGICSDTEPYYVIYDYLDRGDLKQFLTMSRPSPSAQPPPLTQSDLLHIVTQVSTGMSYLYKQQIIHGDLATRNCLISSDLTVKIADLGIGHDLYPEDYHDNGAQLLPIRWMSPELFVEPNESPAFSLASDVWSFGIFCWEVFAYARQPYEEFADAQILRLIPEGHVLSAPAEGCPPLLFSIMQDCWAPTVEHRPLFTNITSAIKSIDLD